MATKDKRHTLHMTKEEDVPMAEEKPQNPQGPASEASPAKPEEAVPSIEEALASLGATSVSQSGYDGGHAFGLWFADFMKKKEAETKKS